jgi:hypothetical protein
MLGHNKRGHYRYLPGIEPYSCGAISEPGYEVVHATFLSHPQWKKGFGSARSYLENEGIDRFAICGVELRCPAPYPMTGFVDFNEEYCNLLQSWDLHVGADNPLARTNVSPAYDPPTETTMHGFSFVAPTLSAESTFVISGAGELRDGNLETAPIVREGETSEDAMREKVRFVAGVMGQRLRDLGGEWSEVTTMDVYTIHDLYGTIKNEVLAGIASGRRHGFRWYPSRPPVVNIEFEMDMRGVRREVYL